MRRAHWTAGRKSLSEGRLRDVIPGAGIAEYRGESEHARRSHKKSSPRPRAGVHQEVAWTGDLQAPPLRRFHGSRREAGMTTQWLRDPRRNHRCEDYPLNPSATT